ncbi:acyltransferase [Mycobacterium sp. Z3061]|uniref:acyltransferase n=1 Tax=Mycobacterium sp. Z3061 TaxID=3073562 RepID=UPI00287397EE|nr:acyltransferase [Mycobacterium sp. Z3061]
MSTQLIRPLQAQRFDVRCNVGDAIVANLAVHIVFFFDRRLDTRALADAFAHALTEHPIFAGRMTIADGRMRVRCKGQGVPFTSASSDRTLAEAVRSASEDKGRWLIDPVNGVTARWGLGPLCKVRVTHLADDATAIGFSWHHVVGDMQTFMHFMNAWSAAAGDRPLAEPLIVEDRAAYLDQHLPPDGARRPGVRCLGWAELARSAVYLAKDARKQRTLTLYFGEDEIARMRDAYGDRLRLSANDVVCAQICEALRKADPAMDHRTLSIVVNARNRCGLDPMLAGNIVTTLNLDLRSGEAAGSFAERIRRSVNRFADEHCDMRINQRFLDDAGPSRAARCVTANFNPARWNPLISNVSGFGVYRVRFEDTFPSYCTLVMQLPVAGGGVLMDGADGRGLVFQMALPPRVFEAMSSPAIQEHLHRFRLVGDDIPPLHRAMHV